jgi:hypothetical protein
MEVPSGYCRIPVSHATLKSLSMYVYLLIQHWRSSPSGSEQKRDHARENSISLKETQFLKKYYVEALPAAQSAVTTEAGELMANYNTASLGTYTELYRDA